MPVVSFNNQQYPLEEGETVLDGLLRQGQELSHSCKTGVCQSCLIQSKNSTVPDAAQVGLKSSLQASAYALACQWVPETDIDISLPGLSDSTYPLKISTITPLNKSVIKLTLQKLEPDNLIECRPGQYFSLINPDGVIRSYSVANDYARDNFFEFHIAKTEHGLFSNWAFNNAQSGDIIQARGPAGACFYLPESSDEPILLAGLGTGLAPLYGILRNALESGHSGQVQLVHGARSAEHLYYQEELRDLENSYTNFSYTPVVREGSEDISNYTVGDVETLSLSLLDKDRLAKSRVFLCGNPGFVQRLRKQVFLRGVSATNIFCDAFIERPHT